MAAFLPIAGALLSGLGGLFHHKSKQKQEQEQARLAHEAATRGWDQKEQTRLALLRSLQGSGAASGPKVQALLQGLDPAMFQARPYAGPELGKETGGSTLGDILSGAGSIGSAAGDYFTQKSAAEKRKTEQMNFLCAIYPSLPDCQGGPPASDVSIG